MLLRNSIGHLIHISYHSPTEKVKRDGRTMRNPSRFPPPPTRLCAWPHSPAQQSKTISAGSNRTAFSCRPIEDDLWARSQPLFFPPNASFASVTFQETSDIIIRPTESGKHQAPKIWDRIRDHWTQLTSSVRTWIQTKRIVKGTRSPRVRDSAPKQRAFRNQPQHGCFSVPGGRRAFTSTVPGIQNFFGDRDRIAATTTSLLFPHLPSASCRLAMNLSFRSLCVKLFLSTVQY